MKKTVPFVPCVKVIAKITVIISIIFLILHLTLPVSAANLSRNQTYYSTEDSSVSSAIKVQLAGYTDLKYPLSVERLYSKNRFKLVWVAPSTVKTHAWDALLLLDCALHYGLNRSDYHPADLLYETLHSLIDNTTGVTNVQKARFDILLTDAMITLVNNLHYGKLNPDYSMGHLDTGNGIDYKADDVLFDALNQKSFTGAIENAQPRSKAYCNLQDQMRLLTGQYKSDCYETPQQDVRTMAVNMERLRWINGNDSIYISINIPSYMLKFHFRHGLYQARVAIGKSQTPTPVLRSSISMIIIGGDIIFKPWTMVTAAEAIPPFKFKQSERAFTNGNIEIQYPSKLTSLIVANTAVIKENKHLNKVIYRLKKPLPVIITYITCAVLDGSIIKYKDIYNLDQSLELALYKNESQVAFRVR